MTLTPERLAEIRELDVDSCSGDAPYNPDIWQLESARADLLAEVDRLTARLPQHVTPETVCPELVAEVLAALTLPLAAKGSLDVGEVARVAAVAVVNHLAGHAAAAPLSEEAAP